MSSHVVNGIGIELSGPSELPLEVVLRESPAYDGPLNFFTVALTNNSERKRRLPFDEISRNVVRRYRNMRSGEEFVDNRIPPPKEDGSTLSLAAGASHSFLVVFEYPSQIATIEDGTALLQFCVQWEAAWLRTAAYKPGAYDWNESFQVCRNIKIFDHQ